MTYLKILAYARKGIRAEVDKLREVQSKALEGAGANDGARRMADHIQSQIDALDMDMATIDEIQEIHDRA